MNKKQNIVALDLSSRAINSIADMVGQWELFVSVTNELPDIVYVSRKQHMWYKYLMIDFASSFGFTLTKRVLDNPTFRGLPIVIKGSK